MLEKNVATRRRRLVLLAVGAGLLLASASPLLADVGVSIGVGYRHGHHGHPHHFYPRFYYSPRYWGPYYPPYYGYGYYGYYPYRSYRGGPFGALDLNVKPKDTQVYVDGDYVGLAKSFDGWPSYLWLERGSAEVILYNDGYETVVRHFEVRPGAVIRVKEQMRPGESARPEELTAAKPPPRRPSARSREPEAYRTPEPAEPREEAYRPPERSPGAAIDARREPGRLRLAIEPADASVYLDGHFLGTGQEFEGRPELLLDPGEHRIEVLRPGYRDREVSFTVEPDESVELEVRLESGTL